MQLQTSAIPEYIAGFLDCRNGIGEKYMQVLFHTKYSERKDPIKYLVILYTNNDNESLRYCQRPNLAHLSMWMRSSLLRKPNLT
jgi:hypothetical protein